MGIGSNLKELMALRGTNVNELANEIGVRPQTLYSIIKRDSTKADATILLGLAKALQVPCESILSFKERYGIPDQEPLDLITGHSAYGDAIDILNDLEKLNDDGKKEAKKRVNELTQLENYVKL